MNKAQNPARLTRARSDHNRLNALLGRGLFETIIVAVGVLLALAVDQWRERSEQRELAEQARSVLRAEILGNREVVLARHRRTSQLYVHAVTQPSRIPQYVFERRNRALLVNEAAWTMAVETEAIRWLTPTERANFAQVYAGLQRTRDAVLEELRHWTQLAGFPEGPATSEIEARRDHETRVWLAWASRVQLAMCVNAGRFERALGANVPERALVEFCAGRRPDEDPASIYREWQRLGWVSSSPPRILTETPTAP